MNGDWKYVPFADLFDWCKKSDIGSKQGNDTGKYPLYIASATEIKHFDDFLESGESLVFGTGGNPCIHYVTGRFAYTNHTEAAKKRDNSVYTKFYYYFFQKDRFSLLQSTFVGGGIKNSSKKKIGALADRDRFDECVEKEKSRAGGSINGNLSANIITDRKMLL